MYLRNMEIVLVVQLYCSSDAFSVVWQRKTDPCKIRSGLIVTLHIFLEPPFSVVQFDLRTSLSPNFLHSSSGDLLPRYLTLHVSKISLFAPTKSPMLALHFGGSSNKRTVNNLDKLLIYRALSSVLYIHVTLSIIMYACINALCALYMYIMLCWNVRGVL